MKPEDNKSAKTLKSSDIHMVRVYQAVTFEKSSHTTFFTSRVNKNPACEVIVHNDLGMVEFKSDKDNILVPYPNVSCIYLKSQQRRDNDEHLAAEKIKEAAIVKKAPKKIK